MRGSLEIPLSSERIVVSGPTWFRTAWIASSSPRSLTAISTRSDDPEAQLSGVTKSKEQGFPLR